MKNGKCGDSLTWSYDDVSCTLRIENNPGAFGQMRDFRVNKEGFDDRPWATDIKEIQTIILKDVYTIGKYAFYGCQALSSVQFMPYWSGFPGESSYSEHYNLYSIGDYAFANCKVLTEIELPESVDTLGKYTFRGCSRLRTIHLPITIKGFPTGLFKNCKNLEEINIKSASLYGEEVFMGSGIKSFIISNGVKIIPPRTFKGCEQLTKITIPDSLSKIDEEAFDGCRSLKSIYLPSSLKIIGAKAFKNCKSLNNVILPGDLHVIQSELFYGCENLKEIYIPETITEIHSSAIWGCTSLGSLYMHDRTRLVADVVMKEKEEGKE